MCNTVGCLKFGLFCYLFSMAYRGDLIACEVDFRGVPEGKVSVLFFLNGIEIRVLQCSIPREINYFLSFHWDLKALQCSPRYVQVCVILMFANIYKLSNLFTKRLCPDCFKARTGKERVDLI